MIRRREVKKTFKAVVHPPCGYRLLGWGKCL